MAKKKKMDLAGILFLTITVIMGVLILVFMNSAGIIGKYLGTELSVYEIMKTGDNVTTGIMIAFILSIVTLAGGGLILVFKLLGLPLPFGNLLSLLCALTSIAAGVLFFFTKTFYLSGSILDSGYNLGIGAILCGIFGIVAGLSLICYNRGVGSK